MADVLASEMMAAAGARELRDGETVVVGLGLPQVACVLAKRTHAPGLSALLEIGVMKGKNTCRLMMQMLLLRQIPIILLRL